MPTKNKTIAAPAPAPADAAAQMGEQLTAQYRRAVSGMVEVLKFGAMLMQIRAMLIEEVEGKEYIRGNGVAGEGLKGWLERHAPEINRQTAYRFMGVADAVGLEYDAIVGTRVSKKYPLDQLALADAEALPEPVRAKQLELFEYVCGTSQRSWLDKMKARDPFAPGPGRPKRDPDADPEADRRAFRRAKADLCRSQLYTLVEQLRQFVLVEKNQAYLDDRTVADARAALADVLKVL